MSVEVQSSSCQNCGVQYIYYRVSQFQIIRKQESIDEALVISHQKILDRLYECGSSKFKLSKLWSTICILPRFPISNGPKPRIDQNCFLFFRITGRTYYSRQLFCRIICVSLLLMTCRSVELEVESVDRHDYYCHSQLFTEITSWKCWEIRLLFGGLSTPRVKTRKLPMSFARYHYLVIVAEDYA